MSKTFQYYLLFKPYGMLSQFTKDGEWATLSDLGFPFEKDVYPVGRLDADSEGLLLLTNDNLLKTRLLDPKIKHWRTYSVQVEGTITEEACMEMSNGITISINGASYKTRRARATPIDPPVLPDRVPPIRVRKTVPDSWMTLALTEGKNRQVRKMTAATGFPTLRLVRTAIGNLRIENMQPGEIKVLSRAEVVEAVLSKSPGPRSI